VPVETITSLQNPRLKRLIRLRDRRARDEEGAFLVEATARSAAPREKGAAGRAVLLEGLVPRRERARAPCRGRGGRRQLYELSKEAFAKVAYRERPDGILAVAPQWKRALADLALPAAPLILVVEAIEKPGNLGTSCGARTPRAATP